MWMTSKAPPELLSNMHIYDVFYDAKFAIINFLTLIIS